MSKEGEIKKIRDELVADKNAPLYEYRTKNKYHPVVGEGNHNANIMFIGEAPGKNEAEQARPFCGRAGKLLDELLESAGMKREEVYITNIVKDRPTENRDPTPEEIAYYAPLLDRQIEIIKPKVIATLGRFSMEYIMKKYGLEGELEPISRGHGKVHEILDSDIVIVPLYHPAAAIYARSLLDTLKTDLQVLKQIYDKK